MNDSVAVIIGAMVIAPLLGPIIAQAMGTTLGDFALVRLALKTNLAGLGLALGLSVLLGLILEVSPVRAGVGGPHRHRTGGHRGGPGLRRRRRPGLHRRGPHRAGGRHGGRGPAAPLAALGLLLGSGYLIPALGAGLLLVTNIICVNLAAVVVFWIQGVRPTSWWEEKQARKATKLSIAVCAGLLLLLALAIILARGIKDMVFLYFY
jgi:uncharacterized membrane protein